MKRSHPEGKSTNHLVVPSATPARLSGALLFIARAVCLALVIPSLGLFIVGIPMYYQQLQKVQLCGPADCLVGGLSATDLQTLSAHGISVSVYAAAFTVFFTLMTAVWCVVGLLLFWRGSDDRLALLAAFMLIINGVMYESTSLYALVLTFPTFDLPVTFIAFLGNVSLGLFLLFFPNGRLVPRWTGLILLLYIGFEFVDTLPSTGSHFDENWGVGWLYLLINFVLFVAIIFSQIYRYRRFSTPIQRQQTKWVLFGGAVTLGAFVGLLIITSFIPSFITLFANVGWTITLPIASLMIPLSIGFSISRYHLYDIDTLINRALVYGVLTILLVLVYAGLVIGLGALLRLFMGQTSPSSVVLVVSTLAIAALFQPLHRRIQTIIDRRFYRWKYDATKTLDAFSATLRTEVDLQQLSEHLTTAVQETMQPTYVSLWLRPLALHGSQKVLWNATPSVSSEDQE